LDRPYAFVMPAPVGVRSVIGDLRARARAGLRDRRPAVATPARGRRRAVDGRRRGEDELGDAVAPQGLEQAERAPDVVLVVLERLLRRLADRLEPGEMDARVARAEGPDHRVQPGLVGQVDLVEREELALPRQLLDAPQRLDVAVHEVVQDRHGVARLEELDARVGPDVPRAARHQDVGHLQGLRAHGGERDEGEDDLPGPTHGLAGSAARKSNLRFAARISFFFFSS